MKRYWRGQSRFAESEEVDVFLEEIVQVCKEHGFSLAHEDIQGGFIVETYDEDNIEWLMDAAIGESLNSI